MRIHRRFLFGFLTAWFGFAVSVESQAPSPEKLPRWRGFNFLEKFSKDWSNKPYGEEDFRLISSLGFDFVRLPMDYRVWIQKGDWTKFDEAVLKEIDQAVQWGEKYCTVERIFAWVDAALFEGYDSRMSIQFQTWWLLTIPTVFSGSKAERLGP